MLLSVQNNVWRFNANSEGDSMPAVLSTPARRPFEPGFFYHAMKGLLEREPDHEAGHGGFCDYIYKPADDAELKEFDRKTMHLRRWLDKYDITFSSSLCGLTVNDPNWGNVLRVMLYYPFEEEAPGEIPS
jgi:hypothetical protein